MNTCQWTCIDAVLKHKKQRQRSFLQVERWAQKPEEKLGWEAGEAWGHRRTGYRRMAELLGGKYLRAYDEVYAREPEHTKSIFHDVTPEVKHQLPAIKV